MPSGQRLVMLAPMHTWPTPLRTVTFAGQPLEYHDLGAGPALVLFHGGNCDSNDWAQLAHELARDHRVIVPDGLVHPHDAWNTWLLLDHLQIERPMLIGHSAGGRPIRTMALLRPAQVRGLIAIDADVAGPQLLARKLPNERFSPQARALYAARAREMALLRPHHQGDYPSQVTLDRRLHAYTRDGQTPEEKRAARLIPAAPSAVDLPRPAPPTSDPDAPLQPPVLNLITGRGKIELADVLAQPLASNRQAADLTTVVMKEFGHWPWLEDQAAFLDVLRPFLAQHQ